MQVKYYFLHSRKNTHPLLSLLCIATKCTAAVSLSNFSFNPGTRDITFFRCGYLNNNNIFSAEKGVQTKD